MSKKVYLALCIVCVAILVTLFVFEKKFPEGGYEMIHTILGK